MRKLALGIMTALTLSLSGCWALTDAVFDMDYEKTPKPMHTDTVSGFVINKTDDRLIMIGQRFVYVFHDDTEAKQLKALLQSPKVSNMKWYISSSISSYTYKAKYKNHALRIYDYKEKQNPTFQFQAHFEYDIKNTQDKATIDTMNALLDKSSTKLTTNPTGNTATLVFSGDVYKDNSAITEQARKNAQALSKQYEFTLYNDKGEISPIKTTKLILLPFAIVGDIISSPIQMFAGLKGW